MKKLEMLNDLAAVFRWTARLNMHEGIANHFSVCLPDSNADFYVNGSGMHFSTIKASDLVLIEQNKVEEGLIVLADEKYAKLKSKVEQLEDHLKPKKTTVGVN